ncbi:TPA: Cas10/Cmr2 second palm domain-containing protein [Photobacterium damselae]
MRYCYLFEAKSIQEYLFQSNKLKDVIAASERLDRLIDSTSCSVLAQVLNAANLASDLLGECAQSDTSIHFLRCKGGAFYAYSQQQAPLEALRSIWTLTVSQLFPSLVFTDALSEGKRLTDAMSAGLKALNAERNSPKRAVMYATTLMERYSRTGSPLVPLNTYSQQAVHREAELQKDKAVDLDTEQHRQAYQLFSMRGNAALQDRFTPESLNSEIEYPIDLENHFPFVGKTADLNRQEQEALKDMALIHIDGNGLGILLRKLKDALQDKSDAVYCQTFRQFSEALNKATVAAARDATQDLFDCIVKLGQADVGKVMLPMRPIVLGGDDVTLLCRADLALRYSERFCLAFKQHSEEALALLFKEHLAGSGLKPYLTASGGVLFHKASHPFMHSLHLVEALCAKAKDLTKSVYGTQSNQVGPAALAMYRVSNATQSDFNDLIAQTQTYAVEKGTICLSQSSYFVSMDQHDRKEIGIPLNSTRSLDDLRLLTEASKDKSAPMLISKWRQIATLLSQHNQVEAERLYHRSMDLCPSNKSDYLDLMRALMPNTDHDHEWIWSVAKEAEDKSSIAQQTFIYDLLMFAHFSPVSALQDKEQML